MTRARIATALAAVLTIGTNACSSDGKGGSTGTGGAGGAASASGGTVGSTGGKTTSLGSGGSALGGAGGILAGGSATGGASSGGAVGSGGNGSLGGAGSGGIGATGGGAAGAGAGGANTGGAKTGGASASGTGGIGTGGVRTGGASGSGAGGTGAGGLSGTGGAGAGGSAVGGATATGGGTATVAWDWSGVVGTGQSLSVGDHGTPVKLTTQPYHNLKLSTGNLPWPVDPTSSTLTMVPLVEPIGRSAPTYPSSWPTNISGETPHSAMGNQITTLAKAAGASDFISVQGDVGENGQCMTYLQKGAPQNGVNGHAYQATLIETQAITRLAKAAGKVYGVGAITMTHGECDAGNTGYENALYTLLTNYNTDLAALTGQTQKIQMIVSQQHSTNDHSASTLAQWKVGVDHPADTVCSGPKYQYPYGTDHIHLITDGYEQLGEKYGQVYYERVVLGNAWQPLQPTTIEKSGAVLTVHYHIPVPPMVWDTTLQDPHPNSTAWNLGKGFEVSTSSGTAVTISSVAISGDAVVITCASDPGAKARVGYAMVADTTAMATPFAGTVRWGQLRDSDPFVGSTSKKAQPNYGVAFDMTAP
jgi:hypothetical protein